MALFAPLPILLLSALLIVITQAKKSNLARSWFFAVLTAFIAWISLLVLRFFLPLQVNFVGWNPEAIFQASFGFRLGYENWAYALALMSLCLAYLLTDSAQRMTSASVGNWLRALLLTGLNLLAVFASTPLVMLLAWALTDLVELFLRMRRVQSESGAVRLTIFASLRFSSILALALAVALGWKETANFVLTALPKNAVIPCLIAASLRLGVLPIQFPGLIEEEKSGSDVLFQLMPVASALVLLTYLPANTLSGDFWPSGLLRGIVLVSALFGAAMWLTRKGLAEARDYWIIALSAMVVMAVLNGDPSGSRVWGLALLMSGGLLFLFNPPVRRVQFLPILGLLGFCGLPFTLAAGGWGGLLGKKINFTSLGMVLAHSFLMMGYLRHILEDSSSVTGLEKHARYTYPLGLVILLEMIILLGFIAWPRVMTVGVWPAALASWGLLLLGMFMRRVLGIRQAMEDLPRKLPGYRLFTRVLQTLGKVLSLNWVYRALQGLYQRISVPLSFMRELLEGEGGVLWSLVFVVVLLVLLISVAGLK